MSDEKQIRLYRCTEERFYKYLKGKNLKIIQGNTIHSNYWVDEDGEYVAYMETSSWGAPDIYMIKPSYCNEETSEFIHSLINNKS